MADVNEGMIQYLASLARIEVTDDEKARLLTDLSKIMLYFEQLSEVDTSHIAPCTHLTPQATQTPLRDDVVLETLSRDTFLQNAPDKISGLVRVPPVLKQE